MASKLKKKSQKGRMHNGEINKNYFSISAKLMVTDEVFTLKKVYNEMKIAELKDYMEFSTGIPRHLQRISYLDEGDLVENSDVRSSDIVPGGTLRLTVFSQWKQMIEAVATNDIEWVFQLGVTQDSDYKTPNSEYMTKRSKKLWLQERALVSLCLAAHRGHEKLVKKLIDSGADVNGATPMGRTALHIAAARGHGHIIDLLLEKGADIDAVDSDGNTALAVADKFGNKSCERHLFLFRWQQRAKKVTPQKQVPMFAHQFNDSKLPVWKEGNQAQLYFSNILPPGEYEGTHLSSPVRRPHPSSVKKHMWQLMDSDCDVSVFHGKNLPMIIEPGQPDEQQQRRSQKSGKRGEKNRPLKFDEWLGIRKDAEQKVRDVKNKEKEKKKLEAEDKKREEEEKTQSYETWLQQRQQEKSDLRASHLPGPPGAKREFDMDADFFNKSVYPDKKGALQEYLESLLDKQSFTAHGDWLIRKELEMLEEANTAKPVFSA